MATAAVSHEHDHAHHPGATKLYVQIAVILFVLTFLEVMSYEVAHKPAEYGASFTALVAPVFVPLLIVLSIAKFALVGMYYMHLKTDDKLLSWVFVFSLLIAVVVVLGLMVLMSYLFNHGVPPLIK